MLACWTSLTDLSPLSLRAFSLLFALWAIVLAYRVGACLYSRREGMWAALLLMLSNFHIYYATEIRMYSMVVAFSLLLTLAFFRAFIFRSERRAWSYGLGVFLCTWTHYLTWLVVGSQGIYLLLRSRSRERLLSWAKSVAVAAIPSLLWIVGITLADAADPHRAMRDLSTLRFLGARDLLGVAYLLGAFHGMLPIPDTMRYGFLVWGIPLLALLCAKGVAQRTGDELRSASGSAGVRSWNDLLHRVLETPTGYLVCVFLLPVGGLTLLSLIVFPLFLPRYLIFELPVYYLLVSRCVTAVTPRAGGQFALLLPAIGWSLLSLASLLVKARWG